MKKTTSSEFYEFCMEKYPGLKEREDFRRFFMYLAFGTFYAEENPLELVIDQNTVAKVLGIKALEQNSQRNFSVQAFCDDFSKSLPLPDFKMGEFNYIEGKARTVKNNGFDEETIEMISNELDLSILSQKEKGKRVNFRTGRIINPNTLAAERKLTKDEYAAYLKASKPNEQQMFILDYLSQVGSNAFAQKITQNGASVEQMLLNLPLQNQKQQKAIWAAINEDSTVRYSLSKSGNTARLIPSWDSPASLKRELRKTLCSGWTDFDLKSAQFTILAYLLQIPAAMAFVESKQNLWKYLCQELGIEFNAKVKDDLKQVIYALTYGMTKANLTKKLTNFGFDSKRFFKIELIDAVLKRTNEWYGQIEKNNGAFDCFGQFHTGREANKIAATVVQAIELDIMVSAFETAKKYEQCCQIVLFQYDGFTISFTNKAKEQTITNKMQEMISERAKRHGIETMILEKEVL